MAETGHSKTLCDACTSLCGPGTFLTGVDCVPGSMNSSKTCKACNKGTYMDLSSHDSSTCKKCQEGKYNAETGSSSSSACENCAEGRYSSTKGLTQAADCAGCQQGQYGTQRGATSDATCLNCIAGKYEQNRNVCLFCPENTFSLVEARFEASQCQKCPPLKAATPERTGCQGCSPGKWGPYGDCKPCKSCDPGKFTTGCIASFEGSCESCPLGQSRNTHAYAASCAQCTNGKYTPSIGDLCVSCPVGKVGTSGFCPTTCVAPSQRPSADRVKCLGLTFREFGDQYKDFKTGGTLKPFEIATHELQVYDILQINVMLNRHASIAEDCKTGVTMVVEMCNEMVGKCFANSRLVESVQTDNVFLANMQIPGTGENCPKVDGKYYSKLTLINPSQSCFLQGNISEAFTSQTFKVKKNSPPTISLPTISPSKIYPTTLTYVCEIVGGIKDDQDGVTDSNHVLKKFKLHHVQGKNIKEAMNVSEVHVNGAIYGYASTAALTPLLPAQSGLKCIAQPYDGCEDGLTYASTVTHVTTFEVFPNSVPASGSVALTVTGTAFVTGKTYRLKINKGSSYSAESNGNATSLSHVQFKSPKWFERKGNHAAEIYGPFWKSVGCTEKELTSISKTITVAGKNGIDECFNKCAANVPNVKTIGLQADQCLCYTKTFQSVKDSSTLRDYPSQCNALCTTESILLCGSAGGATLKYFSYYEWANHEIPVPVSEIAITGVAPEAVTGIALIERNENKALISWDAPVFNGGGLVSYIVYQDNKPIADPTLVSETSVLIDSLSASTKYSIGIRSKTEYGVSNIESIIIETGDPVPPDLPTWPATFVTFAHFRIGNEPKVRVDLIWNVPSYDGNSPIAKYEYRHIPGDPTACDLEQGAIWKDTGSSFANLTLTLDPDTEHTIAIRASNQFGKVSASSPDETFLVPALSNNIVVDGSTGTDTSCKPCGSPGVCDFPCATLTRAFEIARYSGQTIILRPGKYEVSNLVADVPMLHVIANTSSFPPNVILDCANNTRCFATNTTNELNYFPYLIRGITMTGGKSMNGGCISLDGVHRARVENSRFLGCSADNSGGAVYISKSTNIVLKNIEFVGNTASRYGGAVRASSSENIIVESCKFERNLASSGGAISIIPSDFDEITLAEEGVEKKTISRQKLSISNSQFIGNGATMLTSAITFNDGGALFLYEANVIITTSSLIQQHAKRYGGGLFAELSKVNIQNSTFDQNEIDEGARGGGGALACLSSDIELRSVDITNNKVNILSDGGGGWFVFCKPRIYVSLWKQNIANGGKGGGMYFGTMSSPRFLGQAQNTIELSENHALDGGAVSCSKCAGLIMEHTYFNANTALNSGGCVEMLETSSASIENVIFKKCKAINGNAGALFLYASNNVNVGSSSFISNSAYNGGGGAILWGFDVANMRRLESIQDLPIILNSITNVNNSASYGTFIASDIHSLFMTSGPTLGRQVASLARENAKTFEERVFLESDAHDWGPVSGGKVLCNDCESESTKSYLQVVSLDWYNNIVNTHSGIVRLASSSKLAGILEVSSIHGVAKFDNFIIIAPPEQKVTIRFESDATTLQRGADFEVILRRCTTGEFLNMAFNMRCQSCSKGTYGDEIGQPGTCKSCVKGQYQNEAGKPACKTCADGQYQDIIAQETCIMCFLGKFSDSSTGKITCKKCAEGKHGTDSGKCEDCSKGRFSATAGQSTCMPCQSGTFQRNDGARSCEMCAAGSTTNRQVGQVSCIGKCEDGYFKTAEMLHCSKCAAGKFSFKGSGYCNNCTRGRYSNSGEALVDAIGCIKCKIGRYSDQLGKAGNCDLCGVGKYAPTEGLVTCTDCPVAKYMSLADVKYQQETGVVKTSCSECKVGRWTRLKEGTTECVRCLAGEAYDPQKKLCKPCGGGFYSLHSNDEIQCLESPYGTVTFSNHVRLKAGFWMSGNSNKSECASLEDFVTCKQEGSINGLNATFKDDDCAKGDVGMRTGAEFYDVCNQKQIIAKCHQGSFCSPNGCTNHRGGILCEGCEKGWVKQLDTCVPCAQTGLAVLSGIIFLCFVLILIMIMRHKRHLHRNRHMFAAWAEIIHLIRVNVDFMQINSSLPNVMGIILWPEVYVGFLAAFSFVDMDVVSMFGGKCISNSVDFITNFVGMSSIPLFAVLLALAEAGVGYARVSRHVSADMKHAKLRADVEQVAHEIYIMIDDDHDFIIEKDEYNKFLHCINEKPDPTAADMSQQEFVDKVLSLDKQLYKRILKWWWDQKVVSHSLHTAGHILLLVYTPVTKNVFQYFNCHTIRNPDMIFLHQDYTIDCYGPKWNLALLFVMLVIVLFALGFPSFLLFKLYRHRHELYHPQIRARYGFLYSRYQKGVEFWEVHEIARKTLLTGVMVYIKSPILQVLFGMWVCLMSLSTLNYFQPHKTRGVFWMVELSFVFTSLKYIAAALIMYRGNTSSASEKVAFQEIYIGEILLGLDTFFIVCSVVVGLHAIYSLKKKTSNVNMNKTLPSRSNVSSVRVMPVQQMSGGPMDPEKQKKMLQEVRNRYGAGSEEYKSALQECLKAQENQDEQPQRLRGSEKDVGVYTKVQCNENHGLIRFEANDDDFTCNVCGGGVAKGSYAYGCDVCDFDLCGNCEERKRKEFDANISKGNETA